MSNTNPILAKSHAVAKYRRGNPSSKEGVLEEARQTKFEPKQSCAVQLGYRRVMQKSESCQKCEVGKTRKGPSGTGRDGSGQKRLAKPIERSYRTRRRWRANEAYKELKATTPQNETGGICRKCVMRSQPLCPPQSVTLSYDDCDLAVLFRVSR